MGSGALLQSLSPLGLIDEYLLCIHPLVLGAGRRLFTDGFAPATFDVADVTTTATGVIIAGYRQRRPARWRPGVTAANWGRRTRSSPGPVDVPRSGRWTWSERWHPRGGRARFSRLTAQNP
jgi:hypothetical protein